MRMDRGDIYQLALISLSVFVAIMFGVFVYREVFPEYKVYQNAYVDMEEFRSSYTGEPSPPFKGGIKQLIMSKADRGPETIDRCVSCHVALNLEHFSPTKISFDVNGNMEVDEHGHPVLIQNEDYVWKRLEDKIADLEEEESLEKLKREGLDSEVEQRLALAEKLRSMKFATVHGNQVDMRKVLAQHPLMGGETRPFELHNPEEMGCVICHNGNGRSVTSERAHGPVFDGQYEESSEGHKQVFIDSDSENDPSIARIFNSKPGHHLLFQTTPLFVGEVIQARCAQCHQAKGEDLKQAYSQVDQVSEKKWREVEALERGVRDQEEAVVTLLNLQSSLVRFGYKQTLENIQSRKADYTLSSADLDTLSAQEHFLERLRFSSQEDPTVSAKDKVETALVKTLGSEVLANEMLQSLGGSLNTRLVDVHAFIQSKKQVAGNEQGSVFAKMLAVQEGKEAVSWLDYAKKPLEEFNSSHGELIKASGSSDNIVGDYVRGQQLYMSTACYACHKISGLSRGQIGPDLTEIGLAYPWYVKEAITWPQANLKTSTMPNFRLDHEEVGDLMAFLMAQRNEGQTVSQMQRTVAIKEWEAGKKLSWEKPLDLPKVNDLAASMEIFATEGCASCHKLKGYESSVGLRTSRGAPSFDLQFKGKQWFYQMFPEGVTGLDIVEKLEAHSREIDQYIARDVRSKSALDDLDEKYPWLLASFYSSFKYALRAKNTYYEDLESGARSFEEAQRFRREHAEFKNRVRRVLMVYIQEYGLGRDIAPRLHWSGVMRDTEWLVGHFRNPSAYTAKSIMPVMPLDDSKFYALTHMLRVLGKKNRDEFRRIWDERGFDPEMAYNWHCAQCHGDNLHGNGNVSDWIYPIPKNLRDATFLRNLTKERAIHSILHGVKGTPMPPWGETAPQNELGDAQVVLTQSEVESLVDWLFHALPGEHVIKNDREVEKWNYTPKDVLKELHQEGDRLGGEEAANEETQPLQGGFFPLFGVQFLQKRKGPLPELLEVDQVFDVVGRSEDDLEEKKYFIKSKYYTEENIEQGRKIFFANCAHCHGKEAAGDGPRSVTMQESKPRMLTNLFWLRTRDDLRLLRSIKYGVPGTSMTPWGDKTSGLQRIQLVLFIRSLSKEKVYRDDLAKTLFYTFEKMERSVEEVRGAEGEKLGKLKNIVDDLKVQRQRLYESSRQDKEQLQSAAQTFSKELVLSNRLESLKEIDKVLLELRGEIKKERKYFEEVGNKFISKNLQGESIARFFEALGLVEGRFFVDDGALMMNKDPLKEQRIEKISQELVSLFEEEVDELEELKQRLFAKLPSPERNAKLYECSNRIQTMKQMIATLLSQIKLAAQSKSRQEEIYEQYKERVANLVTDRS